MARRILGLDLGSHAVKAVELRQTLRGLEVVQLRRLPLDDPSPALAGELRDLVSMHDLPAEGVVTSVAGDRISTHLLSFPFKDRRKISAAVPFEVEARVPFRLDDYVLDWELIAQQGGQTTVAAALAPRSEVGLQIQMLREAGLGVRVVEAEGLVLANLAEVVELPGLRLLADIGHRKTTLCLCADGRPLATRTLPLAGEAFTRALARERTLGEIEAERVKIEEGVLSERGSAAAREVAERFARELVRTLGAFEPELEGEAIARIDLLGGTAHLEGLDALLADRSGVETGRLPLPGGELGAAFLAAGDPLVFGPAMALALRGTARTHTALNLRQGELQERIDVRQLVRELRPTGVLLALLLVLGFASVVTHTVLAGRQARAAEAQAATLARQALGNAPVSGSPLAALQAAVRSAQKRADTLGVYRGNLSALDVLTEISKRIPADLDVVFEELSIDRQVVQIKGHSPSFGSVDRLRQVLASYPPFSDVSVGDITRDEQRGGQNFNVRISLAEPSS